MRWWLTLAMGRLRARLHIGVAPLAGLLAMIAGNRLWPRYLMLIGVLLLHELGHALAALLLGARRAEVSIWPLFGRADVESFPDRREALVALAGPAVNLAAAAVLLLLGGRPTVALARAPTLDLLVTANLVLGLVNLIPVAPVDGGRAWNALRRRF